MSDYEPCAVCGEPVSDRDAFVLPVIDRPPVTITEALNGRGLQVLYTVMVHELCVARARDEFQPYRHNAPRFAPRPTHCRYCDQDISSESCWCGEDIDHDAWNHGHTPVPMGCTCHAGDRL